MIQQERARDLIILGTAGGWALDVAESAQEAGWRVLALVSNLDPDAVRIPDFPYPVYGLPELPGDLRHLPAFCAVVAPESRRQLVGQARGHGIRAFARLVHPSAQVSPSAVVGDGSQVGALARVGGGVCAGSHVIVSTGVYVGHGTRIESFATILPGAMIASVCMVGEGASIGPHAVLLPHTTVGAGATVAAGAVVTADVPDHCLVSGLPARARKRRIPTSWGGPELDRGGESLEQPQSKRFDHFGSGRAMGH